MSQLAILGSPPVSLPAKAEKTVEARTSGWRFSRREESICGVCWLVAIAGTFLAIGIVGMAKFQAFEPISFMGRAGLGATDNESTDVSMAELLAEAEAPQVNPTEEVVEETPEVPEVVDVPVEVQDLPELAEVLDTEDVFAVPAAPKIETAMKPVDPQKPKPKAAPKPVKARVASSRAASPNAIAGGTSGQGGGGGGSGTKGSGSGKGKMPLPPFPSGAKSRNVSGVLTFSLRVSPAGKVEYAAVVASNCINGGFTASEQDQIAGYICRNWFLPGRMGNLRLPVRFRYN